MTPSEVVWFCNHKYGETAYVVEDNDWIHLYTLYSKWLINKNDYKQFGIYTLYHFNELEGKNYHIQKRGNNIDFLVYEAVCHDCMEKSKRLKFTDFLKAWDLFKYGQLLYEKTQTFNFLSGNNLRY